MDEKTNEKDNLDEDQIVEENQETPESDNNPITIPLLVFLIGALIVAVVCVAVYNIISHAAGEKAKKATNYDDSYSRHLEIPEKPLIYLYPEKETSLRVSLGKIDEVSCIYPEYEDTWDVTAYPDGTLIDNNTGRKYYSLYWEGITQEIGPFDTGFVVKGEDTAQFLEEKLEILGLTEREIEEFIVYWLPRMQNNKYNFIHFLDLEEINKIMPLDFSVEPDSLIRILMCTTSLDEEIEVEEQVLHTPQRTGFVAVEWGGIEY